MNAATILGRIKQILGVVLEPDTSALAVLPPCPNSAQPSGMERKLI